MFNEQSKTRQLVCTFWGGGLRLFVLLIKRFNKKLPDRLRSMHCVALHALRLSQNHSGIWPLCHQSAAGFTELSVAL